MGHSSSKQKVPKNTFTSEVQVIKEQDSTHFGKVIIIKDTKTGQEMCRKQIVSHDKKSFKTQLVYYYNRFNTPHPNLVNVIGYTSEKKKAFCSEKYTINLYMDSCFNTMQHVLEDHIKSDTFISEVQLQLLAQHMITILAEFQKKDLAHGEILPVNIFCTEEAYKLCDPTFDGVKGLNSVTKYLLLDIKTYLAPELVKQVPAKEYELKTNKFKADVFSLGVTLLSLASLSNSEDLYDYENGAIDLSLLESRLKKTENFYSPLFTDLLRELLTVEEQKRPDFLQLHDKLHISDTLQTYHQKAPVDSYAKVPLVKIADKIQNEPAIGSYFVKDPIVYKEPVYEPVPVEERKVFYTPVSYHDSPHKQYSENQVKVTYVTYEPVYDYGKTTNTQLYEHKEIISTSKPVYYGESSHTGYNGALVEEPERFGNVHVGLIHDQGESLRRNYKTHAYPQKNF